MLELDHIFFIVGDPRDAVRRLEDDGWVLDAGQAHAGQGTRNRRLIWAGRFFELLWVTDMAEARANPLRLDRRAGWATTGASPVGLAFRGQVDPADQDKFWLYGALGPRIWIHRDNERAPERPLVFVLEADDEAMRRRAGSTGAAHRRPGELREVRVHAPAAPALPQFEGPPIRHTEGAHRLELVVGDNDAPLAVSDGLFLRR